jgi:hypothetical protein
MEREDLLKFERSDPEFMANCYPNLTEEEKMMLWVARLCFDCFRSGYPPYGPISKFTPKNYAQWKKDDPDFDKYLEYIIDTYLLEWPPSFPDEDKHDIRTEIYRRIGKIP